MSYMVDISHSPEAGQVPEAQNSPEIDIKRLVESLQISHAEFEARMLSHGVERSIEFSGQEVHTLQELFSHEGLSAEKSGDRLIAAQGVVDLLRTEGGADPAQAIKELVELSAYPKVNVGLSEGQDVVEASLAAAKRVGDIIETAVAAHKFEGTSPDISFGSDLTPASTDQERETRAVALAGIMKASMSSGVGFGGRGEDLARWNSANRPSEVGVRYAPSVAAAYREAADLANPGNVKPELADKLPSVISDTVKYRVLNH